MSSFIKEIDYCYVRNNTKNTQRYVILLLIRSLISYLLLSYKCIKTHLRY
jgi:hypothetical protein